MKISTALLIAVAVFSNVGRAQAQVYTPAPMPTLPMPSPMPSHPMPTPGVNLLPSPHQVMPAYPGYPSYQRPSHPVYVTPNQFAGYTPWGGINTQNHQLNNTYFDAGRNGSANNGSRRWVNRPVYDTSGRIIGQQSGWVWNNSITGQEHGDLSSNTDNGMGGNHNQIVQYSHAGGNIKPKQVGK